MESADRVRASLQPFNDARDNMANVAAMLVCLQRVTMDFSRGLIARTAEDCRGYERSAVDFETTKEVTIDAMMALAAELRRL